MHYTATELVLIISAIFTGLCSVIAAWKANSAAKSGNTSNEKLDDARIKLEAVHETTNGNLTKKDEEIANLKQGSKYLRSLIIELMDWVPNSKFDEIREEVDRKVQLNPKLKDSATFNFRNK